MTSSSSIPARKTPLSSLPDLKGTTDDTIPQLLTSPSWLPAAGYTFRQDHTLTNVRLALGYTSLAIAGALFYVDWKLGGWEVTRPYTLPACLAYFALNGALSFWVWAVDRGTVFRGVLTTTTTKGSGGGETRVLTLRSSIKKHEPIYRLHVTYTCSSKNPPVVYQDSDVQGRFAEWFNMYGYIDKPALKNWLAKNIDVIGEAVGSSSTSSGGDSEPVKKETVSNEKTITVSAASAGSTTTTTATTTTTGTDVRSTGTTKRGKAKKKA